MSTLDENDLDYKIFNLPKSGRRSASPASLSELLIQSLFVGKSFYPRFISHFNNSFYSIWSVEDVAKRDLIKDSTKKEQIDKEVAKKLFGSFKQKLNKAIRVDKHKATDKELLELCSGVFAFLSKAREQTESCRIILAPSPRLKLIQSKIHHDLSYFNVHSSAFGFAKNRSALDCANFHLFGHDKKIELLINLDIKNFFGSVLESDIKQSLSAHGFGEEQIKSILNHSTILFSQKNALKLMISACLSLLRWDTVHQFFVDQVIRQLPLYMRASSIISSKIVFRSFVSMYLCWIIELAIKKKWIDKHEIFSAFKELLNLGPQIKLGSRFLPQGSPTSPTLSNIAVKRMDYRLAGLAQKYGAVYSRYADDMSFTWTKRTGKKRINAFVATVQGVIRNHGFNLNSKKTRIVGSGGRMDIVGYIINSGKPTISSKYIDSVRSEILSMDISNTKQRHKSLFGYQNQVESIRGKISFIHSACPEKAQKLLDLLNKQSPPSISEPRRIEVSLDHE
jgi:hypothetical protein